MSIIHLIIRNILEVIKNAKQKEFENTKGVIKIRKSKKNRQHNGQKKKNRQHNGQKKKNKQHNGQKKKYKRTNNGIENIKY